MPAFISYSNQDSTFYSTLCFALDGAGIPRWDVASMLAGGSLADQLRAAIERCEVCIFLATQHSIHSEWCLAELGAFWGAGKRVIIYLADPDLNPNDVPPQFQGNLWANNPQQLLDGINAALQNTHDVFVAAPMAAYDTEKEYEAAYTEVVKVCNAFREQCGFKVYCAVEQCPTMDSFETADVSIKVDLRALRKATNFVMLYPRKMVSSVLLEAGFALALKKYSVYFVTSRNDLPFMLKEAASVFPDVYVQEVDCSTGYDAVVEVIENNKKRLFESA